MDQRCVNRRSGGAVPKLALALVCLLGSIVPADTGPGPVPEADQPKEEENVRKHQRHRPPGRPGPQAIADELRTLDGFAKPWRRWEHATGDWAGGRPWLDEQGLTFEIAYTADFFYNLHGGLNTSDADQYRGLLGVGLTLDTERMGLWDGGTFFVNMVEDHGRDITKRHVGDLQANSWASWRVAHQARSRSTLGF